jgi:hypothetical protein
MPNNIQVIDVLARKLKITDLKITENENTFE